jgi:hypothetical protein
MLNPTSNIVPEISFAKDCTLLKRLNFKVQKQTFYDLPSRCLLEELALGDDRLGVRSLANCYFDHSGRCHTFCKSRYFQVRIQYTIMSLPTVRRVTVLCSTCSSTLQPMKLAFELGSTTLDHNSWRVKSCTKCR